MGIIKKLDKTLANQIAAGEVVERPFSVVKELIENSIDAEATNIKIEIVNGGIDKIKIYDDGIGIEEDDIHLIGDKHSTSKIKNIEDLFNILSFGFRGEALASISSVADLTIESKSVRDDSGHVFKIINGEKSSVSEIGRDNGTSVIVERLFQYTPARLNYLKSAKTEYNHILAYLYEITLSYPQIGFEFTNDGKQVFNYKKSEDLKTRVYNIYGEELFNNMLQIGFEYNSMKISGYISSPTINFSNKSRQHLYINRRPIKSVSIGKAIYDAYNRFIPHNTYPAYILNLQIEPGAVDVNVHPRKLEVRFANNEQIFRAFYHAIEEKLTSISLTNNSDREQNTIEKPQSEKYYTGSGTKFKSYSPYKNISSNPKQGSISDAIDFSKKILLSSSSFASPSSTSHPLPGESNDNSDLHYTKLGKIIGQAYNSYIIVEATDSIVFYDQHALAERIIYERLINIDKKILSQRILIPESINITPIEAIFLNDNIDIFKEMGFDIEILGNNIIIINSIPDFISKESVKELIGGVLEDIGMSGTKKSNTLEEVKNKIYAYTACRSAIKFGHKLSLFEMNKLLNDGVNSYSSTCPHGRPVAFEIRLEDLKGKYKR